MRRHAEIERLWSSEAKCHLRVVVLRRAPLHKEKLSPRFCRADLGWFFLGPANFRRISQRILMANFLAFFFQDFRPPKKTTPKIHAQKLSAFLSNFTFSKPVFHFHADFLLIGEIKKRNSIAHKGVPRGSTEKRHLFGPCIAVHGVTVQVSSSCGLEGKLRGSSLAHKI